MFAPTRGVAVRDLVTAIVIVIVIDTPTRGAKTEHTIQDYRERRREIESQC